MSLTLQRSLLPKSLPATDGVELCEPPAMICKLIHITGLTRTPADGSTLPDTNKHL